MSANTCTSIPPQWKGAPLRWKWTYLSRNGEQTQGIVARYEMGKRKVVIPFFESSGNSWKFGGPVGLKPLYGLESLNRGGDVFIVEGERCAAALHGLGLAAVTSQGGSAAAQKADWNQLIGLPRIIILPDNDLPGDKYAKNVRDILSRTPHPPEILRADLPGLPTKGDIVDWMQERLRDWDGFKTIPIECCQRLRSELIQVVNENSRPMVPITAEVTSQRTQEKKGKSHAIECVCLADVEPESVTWLWPGYLPSNKLAMLEGDPKCGKSTIMLGICARLSKGTAFPNHDKTRLPTNSLFITAEDGLADTIRPRLDASGADVARIFAPKPGEFPIFPEAVDWLRDFVIDKKIALVVIDPIMAFLNSRHDAHKDQEVRQILGKLSGVADETHTAIVCIRHLNKGGGGKAMYRGGGSIAFTAAARVVLLAAQAPEGGGRHVLSVTAGNLSAVHPSLYYRLVSTSETAAPQVIWEELAPYSADDLLRDSSSVRSHSARMNAKEFLRTELANGPRESNEVLTRGAAAGFSEPTLKRAKSELGIGSHHNGRPGEKRQSWSWRLPQGDQVIPR